MAKQKNRYKELELKLTAALIAEAIVFIIYLIAAGNGTLWLKVITAIVAILGCGACLVLLYLSGELLRSRSLWMTCGFAAIVICLLFSLILNYPSPNQLKQNQNKTPVGAVTIQLQE